jgi:hypothetical protein
VSWTRLPEDLRALTKQGQRAYLDAYNAQKEYNDEVPDSDLVFDPILAGRIAQITFLHENNVRYQIKALRVD